MNIAVPKITKKFSVYKTNDLGIVCSTNFASEVYPLHLHDYIEIEYLVSGRLEHELNGIKKECKSGDCWCLTRGDMHSFKLIEPVVIHNICIDTISVSSDIAKFLRKVELPMKGFLNENELKTAVSLFENLSVTTTQNDDFSEEKSTAYLLLLLSLIFENSSVIKDSVSDNGYKRIAPAIEYICQNFTEYISLCDAAKVSSFSPKYFSKLFKDITGYTFKKYLNHIRIGKAKELLFKTSLSVTDIAMECGFESFSTFSRQFKKTCGITPVDFRKTTL